ncbi:MAG: hypothetical protein EPN86_06365 [Nanoarchaeota archaeon]|nr:MAG: hypothetical protein EPN86_06365 [Nanoarchaeota archaeon]
MTIDDVVDRDDPRMDEDVPDVPVNYMFGLKASMVNLFGNQSRDNYRQDLAQYAEKYDYTGSNPSIVLALYDVMPQDSGQGFLYGIMAWGRSDKDFKLLMHLKNPDRLVSYVINTIDDIMELRKLQETIAFDGGFFRPVTGLFRRDPPKKYLANSLLMVANEISMRVGEINLGAELEGKKGEEAQEVARRWDLKVDALRHRVLAYQAMSGASEETFAAIREYERVTGTYESHGFDMGVLEEYFKKKYSVDKPAAGKAIPEELKADDNWNAGMMMGFGLNHDQFFRHIYFGDKEPAWKKSQREREGKRQTDEDFINELKRMMEDPWGYHAAELEVLGVNKDMTYPDARKQYRNIMKENEAVINGVKERFPGTDSQWEAACKLVVDANVAWHKVGPLYMAKDAAAKQSV